MLPQETITAVKTALDAGQPIPAEFLKPLSELGLSIRTKNEETQFLTNHEKDIFDKKFGPEIGKVHKGYEDDIFNISGVKKETDTESGQPEKGYAYMKRVMTSWKETMEAQKKELDDLKEKIKSGAGDETLKKEIKKLEQDYKSNLEKKGKELESLKSEHQGYMKGSEIKRFIIPYETKIKKDLPKAVVDTYKQNVMSELIKNSKFEGETLYLTDEDGNFVKDGQLNLIPVEKVIAEKFKELLEPDHNMGGAGTGGTGTGGAGGSAALVIPSTVKNKGELHNYLKQHFGKLGKDTTSKEFRENYEKYSKDLPLR